MGRRAFSLVGYPRGMGSLWIETHYGEAPGGKFNIDIPNKLDFAVSKECVSDVRQLRGGTITRSQSLELLNVLKSAKVCVPSEKIKMSPTKGLFQ